MRDEETVTQEDPNALTLNDVLNMVGIIDRLVKAGGISGEETLNVGLLRTKLTKLVEANRNGQ